MYFPLRGDENFIKNLKKGDVLYNVELEWNPDKCQAEVNVKSINFDHYEKEEKTENGKIVKRVNVDNDSVWAVLYKGGVQTEKHNIMYGFYETPKAALEAFKKLTEAMDKAAQKAINKEDKRLEKIVKSLTKENANANR